LSNYCKLKFVLREHVVMDDGDEVVVVMGHGGRDLSGYDLNGTICPSFGNLSSLTSL
jgi:hypothetical protein